MAHSIQDSPLGKQALYESEYNPGLLHPIPRAENRGQLGITNILPFVGVDIWNAYEVSWLNLDGKPLVSIATFSIPCHSQNIIESKSFKLYLNSFNQTRLADANQLIALMEADLSACAAIGVKVELHSFDDESIKVKEAKGECIDDLDVTIALYNPDSSLLSAGNEFVTERLYTRLLKSNCPVTGQPDWGTLLIEYSGNKLCRQSLLKYVISFRQHSDFHEHCVEKIFLDLLQVSSASELSVIARYVRRGGLDINPCRSLNKTTFTNDRLVNQ